ncbi:hypothetical protein B0I26_1346 [Anoxybacillus vitaminiphilus]|uniref:Uncharacterized protein n=1 Tax=Paranoxybacillus vitaminiphilus TaxID=581036 RepID=A0A327XZE2_9BACL|nr:hypothetical protein [Anoxybacillus vitaminiphilus]RAK14103.1 hypothetical protein B0I26_1346 [Anoxybacillus vitaminiphilus]
MYYSKRGEGLWFRAGEEEPKVFELDTYISGVVRDLNRLGLYTNGCCDGHRNRRPHIRFDQRTDMEKVMQLWNALQVNMRLRHPYVVTFLTNRERLLDAAEQMRNVHQIGWEKAKNIFGRCCFFILLKSCCSCLLKTIIEFKVSVQKSSIQFLFQKK